MTAAVLENPEVQTKMRRIPVHPVGFQMLVRIKPFEEKLGCLYVPVPAGEMHARANLTGEVISMGPDAWRREQFIEPGCKVGDWVMFAAYAGIASFKWRDGHEYRLMSDDTVLARVDSDHEGLERV